MQPVYPDATQTLWLTGCLNYNSTGSFVRPGSRQAQIQNDCERRKRLSMPGRTIQILSPKAEPQQPSQRYSSSVSRVSYQGRLSRGRFSVSGMGTSGRVRQSR